MKKQLLFLLIISNTVLCQNYSLYGTVKSETGETLIGASVYINAADVLSIIPYQNNYLINIKIE